jgi:hypothetical protein
MDQNNDDVALCVATMEVEAWTDFYTAVPVRAKKELGIDHFRTGHQDEALCIVCRKLDGHIFNRLFGLRTAGRAAAMAVDAASSTFRDLNLKQWAVQLSPSSTELIELVRIRGLSEHPRVWAKFVRDGTGDLRPHSSSIAVREITSEEGARFGSVAATVYGMPPAAGEWIAALAGRPEWNLYAAFDGGELVATGAIFRKGKFAWLGFAATLATHRGKGAQSGLLRQRLASAFENGARLITTETGIPLEGESAASYRNIGRSGFRIVDSRLHFKLH